MSLSAKEAAEQVGMSRQGIMKAIHQGKISAQKDLNGQWQIEPVELFRVYPPASSTQPSATRSSEDTAQPATEAQVAPDAVARENELLWKMLADKDDVIFDLRRRLDEMTEVNTKYAAVIAQLAPPQPRKGWWARLLGGGE